MDIVKLDSHLHAISCIFKTVYFYDASGVYFDVHLIIFKMVWLLCLMVKDMLSSVGDKHRKVITGQLK